MGIVRVAAVPARAQGIAGRIGGAAPGPGHADRSARLPAILRKIRGTGPLDIMALRHPIAPQVAAVAAANARVEDFERLDEAHAKALESPRTDAFEAWAGMLHGRLSERTRNGFLAAGPAVLSPIRTRDRRIRVTRHAVSEARGKRHRAEDEGIFRAIARRNTGAATRAPPHGRRHTGAATRAPPPQRCASTCIR